MCDYPRRVGANDSGRDYEIFMTALLSLRCAFDKNTEDMWVGSNIDQVGDFDDVVLYRQTSNGNSVAHLIQLKHQDNPSNITRHDFNYIPKEKRPDGKRQKSKGDFSLYKYSKGYTEFNDRLSHPDDEEFKVIDLLRKVDRIEFILYTNRGVEEYDFLKRVEDDELRLLNTSDLQGFAHKFNHEKLSEHDLEFLSHLILLTNQVHVTLVEDLLEKEIRKVLRSPQQLHKINLKEAAVKFLAFFRRWIKDKGNKPNQKGAKQQICYTLTKSDIIKTLSDILLERYKLNFHKDPYEFHQDCSVWNESVQDKVLTVVDEDPTVLTYLKRYIGAEIKSYCGEITKNWLEYLKAKHQRKFYNQHKHLQLPLFKLVGSNGRISLYDIYKCLWFHGRLPMLLEIKNHPEYEEIVKILSLSGFHLRSIIVKTESVELKPNNTNRFESLLDLDAGNRFNILNRHVKLQGRSHVRMEELVDDSMYLHIKCNDIVHILTDDFDIGYKYEPLTEHYIKRSLITDTESIEIDEILGTHGTRIISAVPGMGKTVLLQSIVHSAPPNLWVLKVNLNEYEEYYEGLKCRKVSPEQHLEYFYSKQGRCGNEAIAGAVFRKLLNRKRVVVLLDGFDEISMSDKETVTGIVKSLHENGYHTWITTRPIMKSHLERALETTSFTLKPFSKQDQITFLVQYFSHLNVRPETADLDVIERFVKELLDAASANLLDTDREFTGIPLQTKLLADMFAAECTQTLKTGTIDFNRKFDLVDLYEAFIKRKTDILCEKFGRGARDMRIFFEEHQRLFALKLLFDGDTLKNLQIDQKLEDYYQDEQRRVHFLQRDGIISVGQNETTTDKYKFYVRFVHRTFAEFLAAQWLANNCKTLNRNVRTIINRISRMRFPPLKLHAFLFSLLDRMLAKDCTLHLLVINGQFRQDTNEYVTIIDRADRSLLHVLAACTETIDDAEKMLELIPSDTPTNQDAFGYNPLDYAILNESFSLADKICQKFPHVTIGNEGLDLRRMNDYLNLKHDALLRILVPHFLIEFLTMSYLERQPHIDRLKGYLKEHEFHYNLHYAVVCGSESNVHHLLSSLSSNPELDLTDHHGNTALHYAACCAQPGIVRLLLDAGADVNRTGRHRYTPLHYAAEMGNDEVIPLLLKGGAGIDELNRDNRTPLHLAFDLGKTSTVALLISKGARHDVKDRTGSTLIHHAARYGSCELIQELLAHGADINRTNYLNETPLHLAFFSHNPVVVRLLLDNGAKTDKQTNDGDYPLHYAARNRSSECLVAILNYGCDMEVTQDDGLAPLHAAILKRYTENVRILISRGANCLARSVDGNTVLHYAASTLKCTELIQMILDGKGVDVNASNKNGDTPLHSAFRGNNLAVAEVLLARGAVSTTNKVGFTSLHAASKCGSEAVLQTLLDASRGDINKQDGNELNVPLHYAAKAGNAEATRFLIRNGGIVNVVNHAGMTPLHLSIKDQSEREIKDFKGRLTTIRLLLANGADVNIQDSNGNTPVHYASKDNTLSFPMLLEDGVEENNAKFYLETVTMLMERNADVNLKNDDGKTAMDMATDPRIISLLRNTDL